MTNKPREFVERPKPAVKRNSGHHNVLPDLPPGGPLHRVDRRHFAFQERFGTLFMLMILFGVGWAMWHVVFGP